jgi:hypothetical protein
MAKVAVALTVSLDGYIAGPNDGKELPLGVGGQALFEWYFNGDTPSRHDAGGSVSSTGSPRGRWWAAPVAEGGGLG